jgi:hypothetical protein
VERERKRKNERRENGKWQPRDNIFVGVIIIIIIITP